MHQPDLLPYSGFFYKMAMADVMELNINYQYSHRGYQRRVKMRGKWATVPVITDSVHDPIARIRIDPDAAINALVNDIVGRYGGARYFKQRGSDVIDLIRSQRTELLWQFNVGLVLGIRDMLGITTPISLAAPLVGIRSPAIVNSLLHYGKGAVTTHLSGPGARAYMGEGQEFKDAGIELVFSQHLPVTGDSIVSVLMDYRDPLEVVMRDESNAPADAREAVH